MASDTTDIEDLQQQMADLQAKLEEAKQAQAQVGKSDISTTPSLNTQGGAVVQKGVETRNGHFIGRDFIQHVTQNLHSGEDADEAQSVIATYLHALSLELTGLKLGDIDTAAQQPGKQPLELADIYVPLNTTTSIPQDMTLKQWLQSDKSQAKDSAGESEARPVSALEALAEHCVLTLVGKPGGGKSTFGARVLLALAQAWQGYDGQLAHLGDAWTHGPKLPIRVELRQFAEQLSC